MSNGLVNKGLKLLAYFELMQTLRLVFGNESMQEFNPLLTENDPASKDPRYRRVWTMFTLILAASRYITASTKRQGALQVTLGVHVMETLFFITELLNVEAPTIKMKVFVAIVSAIPVTLFLNRSSYQGIDDKEKQN